MNTNFLVLLTVFLPLIGAILTMVLAMDNRLQRLVGLLVGGLTLIFSLYLLSTVLTEGPQIYQLGGYDPPYGIVLIADSLSGLFTVMASAVMFGGLLYTVHSKEKSSSFPAFVPLFLCMGVGLNGALLTGDLFTMFVFVELMVLASVGLVSISDNEYGLEAAIKYVFISGMGSLFLLLGIAAMYVTFGTLNFADMAQQLASGERPLLAQAAAVMLLSAFALKSAVFPFHFWQPDFHTTAPTAVSAMLSSVIVKVGIYGIIRLQTLLFIEEAAFTSNILLVLGIVGIFFGSLSALRTYNGKRVLAYSTIGQVGFILVAIGWGPVGMVAAIVYAFNHAFIKSSLLMIMGLVASYNKKHSVDFVDIDGMGAHMPLLLSVLWFIGGMSLAGLPPLNGFISKFTLVIAGVEGGRWLTMGLAIGSGALTLLYMFRTWQRVFQQKAPSRVEVLDRTHADSMIAPAYLLTVCVLLGIYARPLIAVAAFTAAQIADPTIYIEAIHLFGG